MARCRVVLMWCGGPCRSPQRGSTRVCPLRLALLRFVDVHGAPPVPTSSSRPPPGCPIVSLPLLIARRCSTCRARRRASCARTASCRRRAPCSCSRTATRRTPSPASTAASWCTRVASSPRASSASCARVRALVPRLSCWDARPGGDEGWGGHELRARARSCALHAPFCRVCVLASAQLDRCLRPFPHAYAQTCCIVSQRPPRALALRAPAPWRAPTEASTS